MNPAKTEKTTREKDAEEEATEEMNSVTAENTTKQKEEE